MYLDRQKLKDDITEIIGHKPIPDEDGVADEIPWVWSIKFHSFGVHIDSDDKISLEISIYPNAHSIWKGNITVEEALQEATNFKIMH